LIEKTTTNNNKNSLYSHPFKKKLQEKNTGMKKKFSRTYGGA